MNYLDIILALENKGDRCGFNMRNAANKYYLAVVAANMLGDGSSSIIETQTSFKSSVENFKNSCLSNNINYGNLFDGTTDEIVQIMVKELYDSRYN